MPGMRSLACLLWVTSAVVVAQDAGTAVAEPAAQAVDHAATLDRLFAARGTAAVDREHEAAVAAAIQAEPDNFEVLWRAARWKVWVSDGLTDEKQKSAVAKQGWQFADKARALKPQDALGHYYAAAAVGVYAQGIGILNALGQGIEGKFNERLDKAIQLDPTVDSGGPWMAKGRYFYELPLWMNDLKKSRELLEKTTTRFPNNLRAQLYLAETLLKDGKEKEAKAAIDRVFHNPGTDPAEARRVRERAQPVRAKIEDAQ